MSVSALFPNIKPALLLDFANTKRLDPRVNFTRSTTAAYYDGVTTAKAEENLLLNSVGPLNSGWSLENGYAGTLGSELVTNGDFSSGSTGWTLTGSAAVVSGELVMVSGVAGSAYQSISASPGFVQITITKTVLGAAGLGNAVVNLRTSVAGTIVGAISIGGANGPITFKQGVFLTGTPTVVEVLYNGAGAYEYKFDDVSVKQLTADNATAPDGTATAVTATADAANATFTQSASLVAGEYTFSVYLRRVTGTGDIDITAHSGGTWVTQTITSSWARYTVTQTLTAGTRTPGIRIVTSGDQVEIWGAQLEQRSAATAYTPTTTQPITNYIPVLTAPANVPRFDHNPTTGESLGLLIEEQRTNLLTYSEQFDNAAWSKNGTVSVVANQVIAPDGTLTGDLLIGATGTGVFPNQVVNKLFRATNPSAGAGVANTFSIWVKSAGATTVRLFFYDPNNNNNSGVNHPVTSEWTRVSFTSTASTQPIRAQIGGTDGDIYIWGAQQEVGAFPTSYIPTVAATVTRNADAASMIGSNFSSWYSALSGSLYFEGIARNSGSSTFENLVLMRSGSNLNSGYGFNASSSGNQMFWRGPTSAMIFSSLSSTPTAMKLAGAYAVNDYAATRDGAAPTTSSVGPGQTNIDSMVIGYISSLYPYNGTIKKISYYPQRLTDAQLQNLTK